MKKRLDLQRSYYSQVATKFIREAKAVYPVSSFQVRWFHDAAEIGFKEVSQASKEKEIGELKERLSQLEKRRTEK